MSTLQKSNSQPSRISSQKSPLPLWFIRLIIITSLVTPPTLVAVFSKDPVFVHLKAWGIEYQFQKGNKQPPNQL